MLYRRKNSRYWWCRFTAGGKEIRQSTGTADKKAAEEYEAKLKGEHWRRARMGEKPRRSWEEAVVRWIEETSHKASHEDDLYHLRWIDPHFAGLMLDEITRSKLRALAAARSATNVSNATINRMLSVAHAILRRAERNWEWIDHAPTIPLLPEPQKRIRWLTRDEADRLIAELPEHLADMARFSLSTGLRESNVTGLEWSQVDLARRVAWIHADQAKARRAIGIPLNTDAVLVLRRWQGRHPRRVFVFRRTDPADGEIKWMPVAKAGGGAWRKALRRAGIENFRWHDLRHTWASWHVQGGTPLHVLQELGGWSDLGMVQKYAHLAPEHLAEYAAKIETPVRAVSHTIRHTDGAGKKKAAT
ncbi:integrase [Marichromatium purpuratum 984]|uniref:Integrase n=1 Tax=Marichromatium purpuratum 984 TaxID=765910 RepID=W0E2U4_MARPU|nr:site-specific integrase [Marichromatium purpuratum]AHF03416.1 integrase [Marichromatium purpuratum 984]